MADSQSESNASTGADSKSGMEQNETPKTTFENLFPENVSESKDEETEEKPENVSESKDEETEEKVKSEDPPKPTENASEPPPVVSIKVEKPDPAVDSFQEIKKTEKPPETKSKVGCEDSDSKRSDTENEECSDSDTTQPAASEEQKHPVISVRKTSDLMISKLQVNGSSEKSFSCTECGQSFSSAQELSAHALTHSLSNVHKLQQQVQRLPTQFSNPTPVPNLPPGIQLSKRPAPNPLEVSSPKQVRREEISMKKLPESITLSRAPPPRNPVTDMLANRGITVTPSSKTVVPATPPAPPPAITRNLSSAISITPSAGASRPSSTTQNEEFSAEMKAENTCFFLQPQKEKTENTLPDDSQSTIIIIDDEPKNNIEETSIGDSPAKSDNEFGLIESEAEVIKIEPDISYLEDDSSISTELTPTSPLEMQQNKTYHEKTSQKLSEELILALNSRLLSLKESQNSEPSDEIASQITKTQLDLKEEFKRLKRLQQLAEGQRKCKERIAKLVALTAQNSEPSDEIASPITKTQNDSEPEVKRPKRKQQIAEAQLRCQEVKEAKLAALSALIEAQKSTPTEEIASLIKKTEKELEMEEKRQRRLQQVAEAQRKFRERKKAKLAALAEKFPEAQELLPQRPFQKPCLEEGDQPFLHKTILDIAMFSSSTTDDRRTSDIVGCIKTLSELIEELDRRGFILNRTSTYLRLIPKGPSKRFLPGKSSRIETKYPHEHVDGLFASASIRYLEGLASILGPKQVFFLSEDDKARVPIGLTAAANTEAPLLMRLEYGLKDLRMPKKHQLIAALYAGMIINPNEIGSDKAVGHSGPTYVAIRSGKNSSSTSPASHVRDFNALLDLDSFQSIAKTEEKKLKPVVILTTNGGPDESPREPKVIINAIKHFMTHDLDAFFIATNAPGRSAYNRLESRLAPLSRELTSLILPHDVYGSHLNEQGQTVDPILEEENLNLAGETLAQVWNQVTIGTFPLTARYILPNEEEEDFKFVFFEHDPHWYKDHVRESEYFLQIVKCLVEDCCGKFRSGLLKILPSRFFPPPVRVSQSADDFIVERDYKKGHFLDLLTRRALDLPLNEDKKYLQNAVANQGRQVSRLLTVDLTKEQDPPPRRVPPPGAGVPLGRSPGARGPRPGRGGLQGGASVCQICDKSFPTPAELQHHMTCHRGPQPPSKAFECRECGAQYPNESVLQAHRQRYHGAGGPSPEMALPVVDIQQPGVLSKLAAIGIKSIIPLSQLHSGSGNGLFGLPVVSIDAANNPAFCNIGALGASNILPLGPLKNTTFNNMSHR